MTAIEQETHAHAEYEGERPDKAGDNPFVRNLISDKMSGDKAQTRWNNFANSIDINSDTDSKTQPDIENESSALVNGQPVSHEFPAHASVADPTAKELTDWAKQPAKASTHPHAGSLI